MEAFVKNPESIVSPEKEGEVETSLELYLFRHGKKDGAVLSTEGKREAREMGAELGSDKSMAVAGGSPMDRTLESSLRVMMPNEFEDLDSFSDIESKMDEELKVGKKFYRDDRLGFNIDGPIADDALKAFGKGDYIKWLYNESDKQAVNRKDPVSTTYLRQAGNIAEILKKYIKVSDNFNRLAEEKEEYQAEDKNKLERYLGTHQGVVECFVLDVLKRQESDVVAEALADKMGNGWSELEGVSIKIKNKGQEKSVVMSYPTPDCLKEIEINPKIIDEIILEREDLEKKIKE
jgi:broad specificity phosphatase PhoE